MVGFGPAAQVHRPLDRLGGFDASTVVDDLDHDEFVGERDGYLQAGGMGVSGAVGGGPSNDRKNVRSKGVGNCFLERSGEPHLRAEPELAGVGATAAAVGILLDPADRTFTSAGTS